MFKRFCLFVMVIILSLVGVDCGPPPVRPFAYTHHGHAAYAPIKIIPIWIDKEFSEGDKLAIDDAINQWNFALNNYIVLRVVNDNFDMEPSVINRVMLKGEGWLILKINSGSEFVHDEGCMLTLAFVNEIGGNRAYFIRDRLGSDQMIGVAMHEIGHLLGAKHDHAHLMRPVFNWATYRCVDEEAIKKVAAYQHLEFKYMNYCEYGPELQDK